MILDFFKENYSEVIGAYFDGEKIYLSRRLNDKVETDEVNLTLEDGLSETEQVAEKISVTCAKHGWKTSKLGFCLREGQAITLQSPFQKKLTMPLKVLPSVRSVKIRCTPSLKKRKTPKKF